MKKKLIYVMALCAMAISCKKASMTEVRPLSSSYSDTTNVLMIEDEYPCMKLVTDNVVHLQAKGMDETQPYGIIQCGEPLKTKHRYLPLETTEECLIGRIDKLLSDDSSIFILDSGNKSAFCFSQADGSFICRFGTQGRGPGEYISLDDITIDRKKKEVCLLDFTQYKLLFFSYDGRLLREVPQFYGYGDVAYCGDNLLLCTRYSHNSNAPGINNSSIVLAKSDQTPLFRGFPFPEHYMDNYNSCLLNNFITCRDDVYFVYELSDTIWQIKETGVCEAKYVLKFPGRDNMFEEKYFQQITSEDFKAKTDGQPYFGGNVAITDNFIRVDIIYGQRMVYCISTGHHYYGLSGHYYFAGYNNFKGSFTLNGTSFVDVLQPFDVCKKDLNRKETYTKKQYDHYWDYQLTEEERRLMQKMTPEDNPILVIIDIEPF